MSQKGHQDTFLRLRLSARYRFSQGTLAGTRGKGARRADSGRSRECNGAAGVDPLRIFGAADGSDSPCPDSVTA